MPKQKHKHRNQYRNNSAPKPPPSVPRSRPKRRVPKPTFWTAASAVAGGLGAAALGAFANREGLDPRWIGAGMTVLGGIGAVKLDGNARVASYGLAAVGAGDSLMKWMEKEKGRKENTVPSVKRSDDAKNDNARPLANSSRGLRARNDSGGLDRAFNRVRERLHRIYEDDGEAGFVDEEAA